VVAFQLRKPLEILTRNHIDPWYECCPIGRSPSPMMIIFFGFSVQRMAELFFDGRDIGR
jgi:hypothetical protein